MITLTINGLEVSVDEGTTVLEAAQFLGYPGWAEQHALLAFVLTTTAAVAVAVGLSYRPVSRKLDKVVTPPVLTP